MPDIKPEVMGAIVAFVALILSLFPIYCIVPQHAVGVRTRFGVILERPVLPGLHLKSPFETLSLVQTTVQKDHVKDIPCGVSGGVMLHFDTIEVINQVPMEGVVDVARRFGFDYDKFLIYERIHKEINEWCSEHTLEEIYITKFAALGPHLRNKLQTSVTEGYNTSIKIIDIIASKPKLPLRILEQYEALEHASVEFRVQREKQRVVEEEEKTRRLSMVMRAQSEHEVATAAAEHQTQLSVLERERLLAEEEAKLQRDMIAWRLESEKLQNDRYLYHKLMEAQKGTQRTHMVVNTQPGLWLRTLPFWLNNPFSSKTFNEDE